MYDSQSTYVVYNQLSGGWITMSPNVTCCVSLKSYHPYLQPQKVTKNPKIYCIHSSLPKNAKSCSSFLGPLGVNMVALC
jgi:hypothetical protein